MAITLDNEALEAKIREIGRRTGSTPVEVIVRAIENEFRDLAGRPMNPAAIRMKKFLEELPSPTDQEILDEQRAIGELHSKGRKPG